MLPTSSLSMEWTVHNMTAQLPTRLMHQKVSIEGLCCAQSYSPQHFHLADLQWYLLFCIDWQGILIVARRDSPSLLCHVLLLYTPFCFSYFFDCPDVQKWPFTIPSAAAPTFRASGSRPVRVNTHMHVGIQRHHPRLRKHEDHTYHERCG